MKERPILMSGEMVRAILAGRKTQTRRLVKPQPPWHLTIPMLTQNGWQFLSHPEQLHDTVPSFECPYGKVGDRLWLRETWDFRPWGQNNIGKRIVRFAYAADGAQSHEVEIPEGWNPMLYNYERWRPSIHMPKIASRITLEVTNIRVERLQDITEADIIKEGCPNEILYGTGWYRDLWNEINGKKYPWSSNPFVWVIEFKRIIP